MAEPEKYPVLLKRNDKPFKIECHIEDNRSIKNNRIAKTYSTTYNLIPNTYNLIPTT